MEASDLELFSRTVQQAASSTSGAELDAALAALGWLDAVAEDRAGAVSVLFEHLGRANTTSAALDELLTLTLGLAEQSDQVIIVLSPLRETAAPGVLSGGRIAIRGIGS